MVSRGGFGGGSEDVPPRVPQKTERQGMRRVSTGRAVFLPEKKTTLDSDLILPDPGGDR